MVTSDAHVVRSTGAAAGFDRHIYLGGGTRLPMAFGTEVDVHPLNNETPLARVRVSLEEAGIDWSG